MRDEKWIIRKRWSLGLFGGYCGPFWEVTHSSLPALFGHALPLGSFESAIEYVDARVRAHSQLVQEPSA